MKKIGKIVAVIVGLLILIATILTLIGPAKEDKFYKVYPDRVVAPDGTTKFLK